MSDPWTRAKRLLGHEAEFEHLAEIGEAASLRAEYQAVAAQYRRLALAEANSADAADRVIQNLKREIDRREMHLTRWPFVRHRDDLSESSTARMSEAATSSWDVSHRM